MWTILFASTERQTHAGRFGASKSTRVVGSNLCGSAGVGQIARVVHGVTVGNVVLGTRGDGISSGISKREVQRHFYVYIYTTTKYFIFTYFMYFMLYCHPRH